MTKPSGLNDVAGYLMEPIKKNQDDIADHTFRLEELERVLGTVVAWLLAKEPQVGGKDEPADDSK